jgi:L-alanine-DL-glutamate epimerase-like enolase superfamily enzyme
MNRRHFFKSTILSTVGMALLPSATNGKNLNKGQNTEGVSSLPPIDLTKHFSTPLFLEKIELLRFDKALFVRVTDKSGAWGATMCNDRMENLGSLLRGLIVPFFIGKDLRLLPEIITDIYLADRNYKYAGMPFSNCVGHVELAIWDLLGRMAQKTAWQLIRAIPIRTEVPMYLSSLTRDTTPEIEVERLTEKLTETGAKAVKIKVGGRMNGKEMAGRSEGLLKLLRKNFSSDLTIYADANGSFNVAEGIKMGKILEDFGVAIYEEPCPWEDVSSNQKVTKALKKIIVAGGEQDSSLFRWQFLLDNCVYDLLQPDLYYNGGLLRCLEVAEMSAKVGRFTAPHSPKADPMEAAMLNFAAICPNMYGFQEYPSRPAKQAAWYAPHFEVKNGMLPIVNSVGLGVNFDETIWQKAVKY